MKIRLVAPEQQPEEVTLFFTEHRPEGRKQYASTSPMGKEISVELPSGEYTMQILARGFETVRGLVEIDPRRPFGVDALLKVRRTKPRTFEERLKKYDIDAASTDIVDLDVPPKETRVLNHENDQDKRGFKMLRANNIAKIKELVGNDDARLGHSRPFFGPLPDRELLARLSDGADLRKLNGEEVRAVMAVAREYVYGNSRAVARFEQVLNAAIELSFGDAFSRIPLYFYRVVTIGPGATLEVGNGSAIFACDELRIHKTGILKPVADVDIQIGTYTEFQ